MNNEIWKDVVGYEGLYQVSNLGNVKRICFINNKTIKPKINFLSKCKDKHGYYRAYLSKNGKRKNAQIHRLVAEAFIPNPNNYIEVNHKDENPSNNYANNLEWCNHKYNMNYGTINKRKSLTSTKYKVEQYDLNNNFIKKWDSVLDIQKTLKISKQCISYCCNGKTKRAGKYKWRYANE